MRRYLLLLLSLLAIGGSSRTALADPPPEQVVICSWNTEWLFDNYEGDNYAELAKKMTAPSREDWDWKLAGVEKVVREIKPTIDLLPDIGDVVPILIAESPDRSRRSDIQPAVVPERSLRKRQFIGEHGPLVELAVVVEVREDHDAVGQLLFQVFSLQISPRVLGDEQTASLVKARHDGMLNQRRFGSNGDGEGGRNGEAHRTSGGFERDRLQFIGIVDFEANALRIDGYARTAKPRSLLHSRPLPRRNDGSNGHQQQKRSQAELPFGILQQAFWVAHL